MPPQFRQVLLSQFLGLLLFGQGHLHVALHHHCLELLRAHYGTQTGTGRSSSPVYHCRDKRDLLTRRADTGYLHVLAQLRLEHLLGLAGILAPQVGSIPQFSLAVIDKEVDRLGRYTVEEHGIIAGELQESTEVTTRVSIAPAPGQRRFPHYRKPCPCQRRGTGKRATEDAQSVVRPQRVHTGLLPAEQDSGADAIAANELAAKLFVQRLIF